MSALQDAISGPEVPILLYRGDTLVWETTGRAQARRQENGDLAVEFTVVEAPRTIHTTGWTTPAIRGAVRMTFPDGELTIPKGRHLSIPMVLIGDAPCPNGSACPLGLGA